MGTCGDSSPLFFLHMFFVGRTPYAVCIICILVKKQKKRDKPSVFQKDYYEKLICLSRFWITLPSDSGKPFPASSFVWKKHILHSFLISCGLKRDFSSPSPRIHYRVFLSFSSISGCSFSIKFRRARNILSFFPLMI